MPAIDDYLAARAAFVDHDALVEEMVDAAARTAVGTQSEAVREAHERRPSPTTGQMNGSAA